MQDVMSNKYIYVYYISTLLGLIKLNGAVVTTFSDWFSTWWLVSCFTRFRYHNLEIFIMVKRLWLHKTAAEKPMSSVSGHSLLIDNSSARMKWSTKKSLYTSPSKKWCSYEITSAMKIHPMTSWNSQCNSINWKRPQKIPTSLRGWFISSYTHWI